MWRPDDIGTSRPIETRRCPQLLYWSDHTAGHDADTGIQRVVRNLAGGLANTGFAPVPVGWDGANRSIRVLSDAEWVRLGLVPCAEPHAETSDGWLLMPEIPAIALADGGDPLRLGRAMGLRTAAIVHDLIPAKLAGLYDACAVRFYDAYFKSLTGADLAIATTDYVAADLRRYLRDRGLRVPPIATVPLAAEMVGVARSSRAGPARPRRLDLLTVSRWEPRKNLPRLLRAIERARAAPGRPDIRLTIVGRRGGFPAYEATVDALLARLPWADARRDTADGDLASLYRCHDASVYPSWEEGFGLPILESLWLGVPCLCHIGSSMAEVAPGGGTLMLDMTDEAAIAAALCRLALEGASLHRLRLEAIARPLRTWAEYADHIGACLKEAVPAADPSANGANISLFSGPLSTVPLG